MTPQTKHRIAFAYVWWCRAIMVLAALALFGYLAYSLAKVITGVELIFVSVVVLVISICAAYDKAKAYLDRHPSEPPQP